MPVAVVGLGVSHRPADADGRITPAQATREDDDRPAPVQELLHYHRDSDEAVNSIMHRVMSPELLAALDAEKAKEASDA